MRCGPLRAAAAACGERARVLQQRPESPSPLLELLSQEHARQSLPGDVYKGVQLRIGSMIAARQRHGGGDTFIQTRSGAQGVSDAATTIRDDDPFGAEPERTKGVGETLNGRFVLEECVGFGGMGTVYKALDLRKLEASDRNPYIAIKVLHCPV